MFASLKPRPVAYRVQGAGLLLIIGTFMWVLMPVALALGKDFSGGIGVYILGSKDALGVWPEMLLWLTPLSLVTSTAGVLLLFGRAYHFGLAVALVWFGIGIAASSIQLAVLAGFIAYCIFTGRRSFISPEGHTQPDRARQPDRFLVSAFAFAVVLLVLMLVLTYGR